MCSWRKISKEEKTIACTKLLGGGVVEYGELHLTKKETKEPRIITVDNIEYKEVL